MKVEEQMAGIVVASSRLRRSVSSLSYTPGYFCALNQLSADALQPSLTSPNSTLQLKEGEDQLPDGCFLVERLVAQRKYKVSHEESTKERICTDALNTQNIHAGKE